MQRIALSACAVALILAGCQAPEKPAARPMPEPLLRTPYQPPRPPPPKPLVTQAPPKPLPEFPGGRGKDWLPPGGIQPGLWKVIVVHHSEKANATPQGMNAYHLQRGWYNGLGYDFVIGNGVNYPDGQIYVGPRWKKQIVGAHTKAGAGRYFGAYRPSNFFNEHGIGICLIGNFEESGPTPRQMAALRQLISFLCRQTGISPSQIYGHGEVTHKTACPGRYMNVSALRRSMTELLAGAR